MRAAPRIETLGALYPPTVTPPDRPLPLWRFLPAFVRNPLRSIPRQAYEDDQVSFSPRAGFLIVWLSSPALIEKVMQAGIDEVHKSAVEKRVFDASLAGSVLVTDGADWRWQRRALAPLFRPADLQAHIPAMSAAAAAQVARWRTAPGQTSWPIDQDMLKTTYDVILATMLVGGRPAEAEAILSASEAYLSRVSWEMAYGMLHIPAWLPHPATGQMRRAARQLRASISAIIQRRRIEGGAPTDLLGRLLSARHPDTGEPMPGELIVSNLLTLLEAGHETTAKLLTWTLYLLARAPAWQDRVYAEVCAVAGTAPIDASHLDRLPITQRVLKETLRLYPPAPVMARQAMTDLDLGGRIVPAGSQIIIPIYAVHRNTRLWDDPDRFDPDRFLPQAEAGRPRMQFMPFGGGPRICIGASFAMLEATVLLTAFVRAARFGWDGHHRPEPVSRITLRPQGGMPLTVAIR